MHISRIKVENFGKHANKEVNLTDGIVVCRGQNEGGKSTLFINAPMYAFFGVGFLDVTVDDIVTLGEKRFLVEVDYGPYKVKRNKTSASVVGGGVEISGQDAVTDFFCSLFGISKGAEGYVLVSKQDETAGIIKQKPSEVLSFIEAMTGSSKIDELIERVKAKYPTGSKLTLESMIAEKESEKVVVEEKLSEARKSLQDADFEQRKQIINSSISERESVKNGLVESKPHLEKLLEDINTHNIHVLKAKQDKELKLNTIKNREESIKSLSEEKLKEFKSDDLNCARSILEWYDENQRICNLYETVSSYTVPVVEWEGDFNSLQSEYKKSKELLVEYENKVRTAQFKIKNNLKTMESDLVCPTCGSDISEKVQKINKTLTDENIKLEKIITELTPAIKSEKENISAIEGILDIHKSRKLIEDLLVEVDKNFVPFRYKWLAEVPKRLDTKALNNAQQLISEYEFVSKRRVEITVLTEKYKAEVEKLQEEVNSIIVEEEKSNVELKERLSAVTEAIEFENTYIANLKSQLHVIEMSEHDLIGAVTRYEADLVKVTNSIDELNMLLKADDRNAKMMKAIKDAKGVVLNSIWNTVLDRTTSTFCAIRGGESVVEKTAKGFRVDGLPIKGLSGSAKSVFGIALRSTLRDVFAPTCGFIIFDEPFANMDKDRTAATAGAIQALNGQVIVITHEDEFELGADQVIEI